MNNIKKGIVGILNNPATSQNSHSAGMVDIVSKLLSADILNERDDWSLYDELIIYHGTNFKPGSFNIIGGMNDEILLRANKLQQFKGIINSLDGFQLNDFSIKRKILLYDNYNNIDLLQIPERNNLVIGDSHSISVWPNEDYTIKRKGDSIIVSFPIATTKKRSLYKILLDIDAKPGYHHINIGGIDITVVPSER